MRFYDREEEIKTLLESVEQAKRSATFCVLTGRRRVGKTTLLIKALEGREYAYIFVSKDSEPMLCQKVKQSLEQQIGIKIYGTPTRFRDIFEVIMQESLRRHFTVVMDEFQMLYKVDSAIFGDIQDLWDKYHRESKLCLIVSGSVQTLMKRIFEENGEPLYGRPTAKFILRPFRINVLKQIFADHCPDFKNEDLLCLYMITGGVAKYVELLIDAQCFTKEKMLNYVCRQDSYFLTEGRDLINQEFSDDSATYFSILQLIASGMTRRSDIDGVMRKNMGVYLQNLDRNYQMINRLQPLLAKPGSKVTSYEIRDMFLRFWFRFICPYQALIEQQQFKLLRNNMSQQYEVFTGKTLERYFQQKFMETGRFTEIGNWWDRKGENEIDMLAINEFEHTGIVAEVKRNPKKINLQELNEKIRKLPSPTFGKYNFEIVGLSIEDM